MLGIYLFEAVELTKNVDRGKYSYSGYSIRFAEIFCYLIVMGLART